jgi:ferrous iron transport protein B
MKFTVEHPTVPVSVKDSSSQVVILGAPNCGKTALFNRLTGLHHKVGNYPGITVEQKSGTVRGSDIVLHDLPGAYNLEGRSIDERIVAEQVGGWQSPENRPGAVLVVLDAVHLSRSLYLALQVIEFGLPTILILNFMDEARKQNISIDAENLRERLNVQAVIKTSAKTGEGVPEIIDAIRTTSAMKARLDTQPFLHITEEASDAVAPVAQFIQNADVTIRNAQAGSLSLLGNEEQLFSYEKQLNIDQKKELAKTLHASRESLRQSNLSAASLESISRYAFIDDLLASVTTVKKLEHQSLSEKFDRFLLHPLWGGIALLAIFTFIFNAIFTWAQVPMRWIETGLATLSEFVGSTIPGGALNSLLTDGVISGVGNVVIFLPQIMLLIFFLGILEDSGYMSRISFFLDRAFRRFGLQGKAVLPMLSGFACAIPAVMAARTIENRRDRLITILLIPLMSCSARLPVYMLLIAAFVPAKLLFGFVQLQTLVLLGAYMLGAATAIVISAIINKLSKRRKNAAFIMELPPYRLPLLRSLFFKVYDAAKLFLVNAGSIILALSVVIWFLASYPKTETSPAAAVEQSYAGQIGHAIEPIIKPLGFDWKIGLGLVTSFAAREVLVSSFATIYNLENESDESVSLITALKNDRKADGSPTYSPLVGVALLVFFVFAAQCMSTFAIIKRETNSWLWPTVMVVYMNVLAYAAAFIVHQGGQLFGLG